MSTSSHFRKQELHSLDIYKLFGIEYGANSEQIKTAYRVLAKKYHPDTGGTNEGFKLIKECYDLLCNSTERQQYDVAVLRQKASCIYQIYTPQGLKEVVVLDGEKTGTGLPGNPLKEGKYQVSENQQSFVISSIET